ncbi:hypothetical protein [Streptosporangium sp. NPDC087985]|uniref:hypothetical protein n=1 Tax=Streptosporangium sp. NPDC087985 TaxID=3366196 RepID=UPI00381AC09B
MFTPQGATGPRPLILMGHGGGQHKKAPGVLAGAHRFAAEGGFAVAAIDAPNHGDRPKDGQFIQFAGDMRARMAGVVVGAGRGGASGRRPLIRHPP